MKNKKTKKFGILLLMAVLVMTLCSGCRFRTADAADWILKALGMKKWCCAAMNYIKEENAPKEEEPDSSILPDVYQILLVGSDHRDTTWNGNSDTIMLLSINRDKKTISLISMMRDMGVEIPGHGYGKVNSAFAIGGGSLLKSTVESNFQITVDNYISTDFWGMAHIIDIFGGVEINVPEDELDVANGCIRENASLEGLNPDEYYIRSAGLQQLNGIQAVGYMRNRHVGNNDFERTDRQRAVMEQLALKIREMSMTDLWALAKEAAGETWSHDLTGEQIAALAALLVECRNYTFVMDRIPYDGLYTWRGENIDPLWPETIAKLKEALY